MFESSNPTLDSWREAKVVIGDETDTATLQGVADKTTLLVGLATLVGGLAYAFLPVSTGVYLGSLVASMILGLGIMWKLNGNPTHANVLAPIYAAVEGCWLGVLTRTLDHYVSTMGPGTAAVGGTLALPAFVITISCVVAMLVLFRTGILRPTETFKAVVMTFSLGVFLAYMAMFVLSLFGIQIPFLSAFTVMQGGQQALIGLGLNIAILGLASLYLIIDFGQVEAIVHTKQPKVMEWFGAFTLLVTLAWIYFEAVRLAFRVAMLLNKRD